MRRKSKQKEAIIQLLTKATSHPTAEWVYQQVKGQIPNISLGTVYRNLRLLKEEGLLQEICLTGGSNRFDTNTHAHYHFRCDQCGEVHDLDVMVDNTIEDRVAAKTGFKVTHHNLELGGLCLQCQKSATLINRIKNRRNIE